MSLSAHAHPPPDPIWPKRTEFSWGQGSAFLSSVTHFLQTGALKYTCNLAGFSILTYFGWTCSSSFRCREHVNSYTTGDAVYWVNPGLLKKKEKKVKQMAVMFCHSFLFCCEINHKARLGIKPPYHCGIWFRFSFPPRSLCCSLGARYTLSVIKQLENKTLQCREKKVGAVSGCRHGRMGEGEG